MIAEKKVIIYGQQKEKSKGRLKRKNNWKSFINENFLHFFDEWSNIYISKEAICEIS